MSEAKKNPFISEDSTVQKVMEYANARLDAGEYSVAAMLYSSMHNIDESNFYAKFKSAVAMAQCNGKEYDADALAAWSDVLFEARDLYYEYAGETDEFIDVIGGEIKLFESIALARADKAKKARITLARKFGEEADALRKSVEDESEVSTEVQKLAKIAAAHDGMLVSFTAALVSEWAAQILGILQTVKECTNIRIDFFETLRKKAAAQRGNWHVDTREFLHESIKATFDVPVGESAALFAVIDKSIDKILEILDKNIAACKEALYAKYWLEHPEERKALEDKKAALEKQLSDEKAEYETRRAELEKEIAEKVSCIGAAEQKSAAESQAASSKIEELKAQRKAAGAFNLKAISEIVRQIKEVKDNEKNRLEAEAKVLALLGEEKKVLEGKVELLDSSFKNRKEALESELAAVVTELTKERV